MNKFVDNLQRHPVIVVGMFTLTVISTILTIALGWEEFYTSFLAKKVELPLWVPLLLLLIGLIVYLTLKRPDNHSTLPIPSEEFELVEGKSFGVQQVEIDGKNFVNCKFDGSELIYRGLSGFSLQKSDFMIPPKISFQDYAAQTLMVLKVLYQDPIFRPYVEKSFGEQA